MVIKKDVSLKDYNTFNVEAKAGYFIELNDIKEIDELLSKEIFKNEKKLIIGGGSNILFLNDFNGLIIRINTKGMKINEDSELNAIVEAQAGELWHDFVKYCLNNSYYGIENLALIPGQTGAAPVQNIGAYGVEQKDFFHKLKALDLQTGFIKEFTNEECKFSYRNSAFKNEYFGRYLILSVEYKLLKIEKPNLTYKELRNEIEQSGINNPRPKDIFETVCKLRKKKLPEPFVQGNAGSFFKNPIIKHDLFEKIKEQNDNIPFFITDENTRKIPAGWLIEKAGWKGKKTGNTGVSENHALVLINYGEATGREIYELSNMIISSVYQKFGILLEPEVLII